MLKKLSIISILLFSAGALVFVSKISAQESSRAFIITPPTVQVSLDPGQKTEGTLKITNEGETSLNFNTLIQDFIVEDENGTPKFLTPNSLKNKFSGASWLAVYPNQVYVSPKKSTEFKYYIQVPADARPGGHYAAVIYTPTNTIPGGKGSGASVNTSVATLFYITVNGPVTENATITKFTTNKLWEAAPEILTTQINNLSDIHISPKGTITVKNMLGKTTQVEQFPKSNVFPGVSRGYHTTIGKGFMLGRYTADVNLTYGSANKALAASTSFWVIPWKMILVIIIIIAVVIGVIMVMKKKGGIKHQGPSNSTPPQHPNEA